MVDRQVGSDIGKHPQITIDNLLTLWHDPYGVLYRFRLIQPMPNRIIDLFSGCGGFSLGAELAGFQTAVAIDIDGDLQHSFSLNFPKSKPLIRDVTRLDAAFWRSEFGDERPAGVIGGPPCQGFSRIGKRDPNDPRNSLIGHFFAQVNILHPKFFVMENVEGLLDDVGAKTLEKALAQVADRYEIIGPLVVNAASFGAATDRKRVIVVGYDPEEVAPLTLEHLRPPETTPVLTVADAIGDLPSPGSAVANLEGRPFCWAAYPMERDEAHAYARICRTAPPDEIGWKTAKDLLTKQLVSGLMPTKHTAAVRKRFSGITPGQTDPISRFPRLTWTGRCPTLRAGTGRDRGSHQSMRPIHPSQPRVITVREAARLQGFPDWFVFHPTIWHSFRMIGNSVSPIVSKAILDAIRPRVLVPQ